MMGLVIVAHGSRRVESNEEVLRLTGRVRARLAASVPIVSHAFLEMASPPVGEAIDAAVLAGATRLAILPYFLAAGHHVDRDLPAIVEAKRRQHPAVTMGITPHIGGADGMTELVTALVGALGW